VVALILAVSPGFAVAPIISCIPDVIISDVEQNAATEDNNFFIFSDALDLSELFTDNDTTDPVQIRWSFIQSSGPEITINGLASNTGSVRDPLPAHNIWLVNQSATFRNEGWSPDDGSTTWADPGVASADSIIEMFVSDGVDTDSQEVIVTSVNDSTVDYTDGTSDGLVSQAQMTFDFASSDEDWAWYSEAALTEASHHVWTSGQLEMGKTVSDGVGVYGTWESDKNPATGVRPSIGCVLRARFTMSGTATGAASPGFRFRANWAKVAWNATFSIWALDLFNPDYNANSMLVFNTYDAFGQVTHRSPEAGQVYTLLYYPEQTPTLMDEADAVVYLTADLYDLDAYGPGGFDDGRLHVEQVEVDGFDRPERDPATSVPALCVTNFSSWTPNVSPILGGTASDYAGVVVTPSASNVTISCTITDQTFDATCVSGAQQLESGRYYRSIFMMASTQTPGGNNGPLARCGFVSTTFVYSSDRELKGGGLYSALTSTPRDYETWTVAPSENAVGSGLTEPMQLRLESWLGANVDAFSGVNTEGTITLSEVYTEVYDEADIAP
jgi:hypothetical protein